MALHPIFFFVCLQSCFILNSKTFSGIKQHHRQQTSNESKTQQWTDFDKCCLQQFQSALQAMDLRSAGRRHIVLSNTMAKGSDGWLVALKKKFKYLTHFSALFFVWQVRIQQGLRNTHVGCCFPWVYFSGRVQRIKQTSTVE